MWPQIIGSIATGMTGLVVAIAGLIAGRSQGNAASLQACKGELDHSRRQLVECIRHMYRLERIVAGTGTTVPARPQGLRDLIS